MAIRLTSIEGNRQKLDGGAMFGNAPRPMWERWSPPDDLGRIDLACRSLLVEIDDIKILCETGIGHYFDRDMAERFGVQDPDRHILLESLDAMGVGQETIDYVILSHLHFDHAGGLIHRESAGGPWQSAANCGLYFPKAKYVVGQVALERCRNPHIRDRVSFPEKLAEKLESSGRLIVPSGDRCNDLPDAMRFVYSDGHTPGQMHTIVTSGGSSVLFCGDLIPGLPWVHLPMSMGYDRFPEKLIDEKSVFLRDAEEAGRFLFFTHDVDYAMALCKRNDKGRYQGTNPVKELQRYPLGT